MSQSQVEWAKAKAEQVLRRQVEVIGLSKLPDADYALGMVEMAYATGQLDDVRLGYWRQAVENAVNERRQELINQKCAALFQVPALVNGELINQ